MPLYPLPNCPSFDQGTSVCLGMFDGVHLGHQRLAQETVRSARSLSLTPIAFTFDRSPAALFRPDIPFHTLTSLTEKSSLLHACGLTHVIYAPFDARMADVPYQAFFEEILLNHLQARHLVVGFHYHFGKDAKGDAHALETLCSRHGISLSVIPPVTLPDGRLISSTAIRRALECGDIALAHQMLGR